MANGDCHPPNQSNTRRDRIRSPSTKRGRPLTSETATDTPPWTIRSAISVLYWLLSRYGKETPAYGVLNVWSHFKVAWWRVSSGPANFFFLLSLCRFSRSQLSDANAPLLSVTALHSQRRNQLLEYLESPFDTLKLLTQRQQTKTNLIEHAKGKLLAEDKAINKRLTESCAELCNYNLKTDARILRSKDDVENWETWDSPILKEDVNKAVLMLKDGRSPGLDNIPPEIQKHGGHGIIDALTVVCHKIWTSG